MKIRIRTAREVLIFTAAITAVTVAIPVVTVLSVFEAAPHPIFEEVGSQLLAIAAIIPLFITPPIALLLLNMIRQQTEMLENTDARIMYDILTGVFNRNHFLDSIRASDKGGPLMIIDADHFKSINDNHGHAVGDEALRILANAIRSCVGDEGFVGRLGGEEFAVFLPGRSERIGRLMAEVICDAVRGLVPMVTGPQVKMTVSIGCGYHRMTSVIGHSLKKADDLLYLAKASGRDRVVAESDQIALQRPA
jgi:diguanylate cyclase